MFLLVNGPLRFTVIIEVANGLDLPKGKVTPLELGLVPMLLVTRNLGVTGGIVFVV